MAGRLANVLLRVSRYLPSRMLVIRVCARVSLCAFAVGLMPTNAYGSICTDRWSDDLGLISVL